MFGTGAVGEEGVRGRLMGNTEVVIVINMTDE
jgi:hypothetical protein